MEYQKTNLIRLPLQQEQEQQAPASIAEIMAPIWEEARALREMTPERAAVLKELKERLKIPQEAALSTLDIPLLKRLIDQHDQCPKCGGRSQVQCKKVALGDGWKPTLIPCPLQEKRRHQEKVQKLMSTARIPKRYRDISAGKDFEITAGNSAAIALAERCIDGDIGAYFYGKVGVGKTMLSCVIANERARIGKHSLFITVPDMLEELRDFDDKDRRAAKLKLLYETPCLIVDDLGAEKATPWAGETLFRIFNARYNEELQTIVTSNFALEKVASRLPDYSGERVVRRIAAICQPVYMER